MPRLTRPSSLHAVIRRAHMRMAGVAIALAVVLLLLVSTAVLRLYLNNNLQLVARSLAYTVEASLVFGDRDEGNRVLGQMLEGEGVSLAEVRDAQGALFVSWATGRSGLADRLGESLAAGLRLLPAVAEVQQDGRRIGAVVLRSNGAGLVRFLCAGALVVLLCIALSAFVGMRLSRRMLSDIAEPLQDMARVARAVRHERSMEQRVAPARIAELRALGDDFNALLSELQARHERLEQQNSLLARQARRDSLTGLYNRAYFEQGLVLALAGATQSGQELAVLFLDNDRFKQVNDCHGHAAGDSLLKTVGLRLQAQVRKTDVVARLGGDEFAVLLCPVRGMTDVQQVVDKILDAMQEALVLPDGTVLQPSLSVGVALFPTNGRSVTELMAYADQAMYEAKAVRHQNQGLAIGV